jgi:hypothetical protein
MACAVQIARVPSSSEKFAIRCAPYFSTAQKRVCTHAASWQRTLKGIAVNRTRPLLIAVLAVVLLGASATAAQAACNKTWIGGSGNWSEASHWSPSGAPESSESACITESGTYTVRLSAGGGSVKALTVGGASGVQSVEVDGTSYVYNGETQRVTALATESGSFASNTRLILNATGGGTTTGSEEPGASAFLAGGPIDEHGQVETLVTDPKFDDRIKVNGLKIEPGASMQIASGTLKFIEEGEGAYPWSVTNEGTFTVAASAAVTMQPSFAGDAAFTNNGSLVNNGSMTGSGTEWVQSGGSESGNEVVLQNGSTLVDSAGTGSFLGNYGTLILTGTIPAGQTVIVRGEPFNYGGETYNTTGLSNGGTELVNDGTLVLNPTGSGETGGAVNVEPGSIHNNGVIDVETETASRVTQIQESVTNGSSGHLEINGGILQGNSGARLTNEGLVTIAPGAVLQLQEASAFVNDGTFSPEIASATSFGAVQLFSPCCNGPGVFTSGGTLAPVLVGGFTPAAGQELDIFALDGGKFEGTFASLANGFTADYTHESSEAAFVGVVYGAGPAGAGNTGPSTGAKAPGVVHLTSVSAKHGKITVKLSCPAGGAACGADTLTAAVVEHFKHGKITAVSSSNGKKKPKTKTVVIATANASLAAGSSETVTLKLNAAGRALLARYGKLNALVTVSANGKTIQKLTVRVLQAPKPKKR